MIIKWGYFRGSVRSLSGAPAFRYTIPPHRSPLGVATHTRLQRGASYQTRSPTWVLVYVCPHSSQVQTMFTLIERGGPRYRAHPSASTSPSLSRMDRLSGSAGNRTLVQKRVMQEPTSLVAGLNPHSRAATRCCVSFPVTQFRQKGTGSFSSSAAYGHRSMTPHPSVTMTRERRWDVTA